MKVIKNTYPRHENVAHGEPGDVVEWEMTRGRFNLVRDSDKKTIFSTAPVDPNGKLVSNGKPPVLFGVVAQIKKHGRVLVVE